MENQLSKFYLEECRKGDVCPYCDQKTTVVERTVIVKSGHDSLVRACVPCEAFVGLSKIGNPLGSVANYSLRSERAQVMTLVNESYSLMSPNIPLANKQKDMAIWMVKELGLPLHSVLVSQLNLEDCKKINKALRTKMIHLQRNEQLTLEFGELP